MKTVIRLPVLTAGLNGSDGLIRSEQRRSRKKIENIQLLMRTSRPRPLPHPGPVVITYIRFCHREMDHENAYASFKYIGDALVKEGIILDDAPKIVKHLEMVQVKVPMKTEQHTVVVLEDVNAELYDLEKAERIEKLIQTL